MRAVQIRESLEAIKNILGDTHVLRMSSDGSGEVVSTPHGLSPRVVFDWIDLQEFQVEWERLFGGLGVIPRSNGSSPGGCVPGKSYCEVE